MARRCFTCHSCGKKVEFLGEEPPCKQLSGWLMVSHWEGKESANHYSFCSFVCLQKWSDDQVPKIPEVFLKSLGDENDNYRA